MTLHHIHEASRLEHWWCWWWMSGREKVREGRWWEAKSLIEFWRSGLIGTLCWLKCVLMKSSIFFHPDLPFISFTHNMELLKKPHVKLTTFMFYLMFTQDIIMQVPRWIDRAFTGPSKQLRSRQVASMDQQVNTPFLFGVAELPAEAINDEYFCISLSCKL